MPDRWEEVAIGLESRSVGPTAEQRRVATALGFSIEDLPAPVFAVLLRDRLSSVLLQGLRGVVEIPDSLVELEDSLGIATPAELRTNSGDELSAWYESRYMMVSARGLRDLKPQVGDVVTRKDDPSEQMVVSSIGANGRIYMKGGRGKRAWPNHLDLIARDGDSPEHATLTAAVEARIRNERTDYAASSPGLTPLEEYKIRGLVPSAEAVRELEDLLESGERLEEPFQHLLERHPQLLASLVVGNWATYVIPQQRLGSDYVTDFLVLGVNSLGPQWLAVEIEAPRHHLLRADEHLRQAVNHAIGQIEDWREWLTQNVTSAQVEHHLHGITNQIRGLVVIGRGEPQMDRASTRAVVGERQNIDVHSWDWLLRQAKHLIAEGRQSAAIALAEWDELEDEEDLF